jgi:DNA-binding NtrC family response regulator
MTEKRSEIDGMHILAVIDDGFDREYFELFFGRDRATVDIFYRHDLAAAAIDKKKYDAVVTDLCLWEDSPQPQAITFIEKCIEKKIPLAVTSAARWEYEIPQFERLVFVQTTEIVGGMYPAIKAAILEAIEKVEKANASELTGLQILVVDDEEDVTREIALLTQKGANVKHVKSHKIALEEMRRNKYSVVISDLLDLGEEKVGPETKAFMQECLKRGIPLVVLTNAGWDTVPEFEHVVLLHKLDLIMLSMNEKSNEHEKKWVSAIKTAIKTAKTAVVTDEKPPIDMDKPIGGGLLSKATYPKARVLFIGDAERGKKLDKELYSWYNVAVKTIETIAEALESLDRYSAVVIHEQYLNDKDYPKLIEICGKTGLEVVVQSNDASKGRRIISDPVDKKGIGHLELLVSIYEEEKMIKTIEKRGRGTVLVVENEEPQRFCIGSRVGKIADIIFAEDLDEGLERIKGKRIDVVIFDLRGVGQNLEEFCNKMYEKGIPMIVYTGA